MAILNPKTYPARAGKYMVRKGTAVADEFGPVSRPDKTIEQAVPVEVTALPAMNEKAGPSETMNSATHSWPLPDRRFDFAYCAKPARTQQTVQREEHCIDRLS